jgi:hypothetical protein
LLHCHTSQWRVYPTASPAHWQLSLAPRGSPVANSTVVQFITWPGLTSTRNPESSQKHGPGHGQNSHDPVMPLPAQTLVSPAHGQVRHWPVIGYPIFIAKPGNGEFSPRPFQPTRSLVYPVGGYRGHMASSTAVQLITWPCTDLNRNPVSNQKHGQTWPWPEQP